MAAPALSTMDWSALYEHLAHLRVELEKVTKRTPVNLVRFRELRQQISETTSEIARYHQRPAQDKEQQEQLPPQGG